MHKSSVIGGGLAIALAIIIAAASGYGPWSMMGGHGPGMMRDYGPSGRPGRLENFNLNITDVKSRFERWIAGHGNSRIKIGEVKETDGGTITVDVVTQDNSLVQQFIVDRRTGYYRPNGG
jgi:hypothetical protein